MKVKDCMCTDVCYAKPDCKVYDVAKMMGEKHVGCIPVCDDKDCVVGIITDRDILLRCVACDKDYKQTPISDIMTTNICTCNSTDDVSTAESKMSEHQIRRIPVVENNTVVGILTMGDLAQNGNELGKKEVCSTISNICGCEGQTKNAE